MQRLTDQLVRDVRSVVIAGVDVVHPRRDGLTQYGHCRLPIPGRPEYSWAGQPHRTVPKTLHGHIAEAKCAGTINTGHRKLLTSEVPVALPSAGSTVAHRRSYLLRRGDVAQVLHRSPNRGLRVAARQDV